MRKWLAVAVLAAFVAMPLTAQENENKKKESATPLPQVHEQSQPAPASLFANVSAPHSGWALAGPPRMTPFAPAAPPSASSAAGEAGLGRVKPKVQIFGGYSLNRLNPGDAFQGFNVHGLGADVEFGLTRWAGLVADFAGGRAKRDAIAGSPAVNLFSYLFGPRLSLRKWDRVVPFGEILFGGVHGGQGFDGNVNFGHDGFGMAAGGGVDAIFKPYFGWRMIRADYLMTSFSGPLVAANGRQNNYRLSTGPIFRFGVTKPIPPPPPNQAPVASCSVTPASVYAGSGDAVTVHVAASDPDNDSLTYGYTVTGGAVEGTGADVRWTTAGLAVGSYGLSGKVDDGKGGTANCAANVKVEERPNRPPVISCSAERSPILQGERSKITANASDPDNDPVAVSWKSSGGQLVGSGSTVEFDATGVQPGAYTVNCGASDGRGGTAESSTKVEVQAPPQIAQLEVRLALHSIYFPTAQPTVAKPTGGLLASQQKTLVTLADDFKKYLTYKPDAHLILQGHADVRGTKEYNKGLSERRVSRTKSFLIAQGVPEASMETRALGAEANLDAEQVKQLVGEDPDLKPEEKQKIVKNLQTVVLANNRRVDVTLSTTGEQSIRRFPFNAEDALTLISTKGGAAQKPAAAPAAKKKPAKKP